MKVHRIVLTVIDFDGLGADEVVETIESQKYPNHCIAPNVASITSAEIEEWSDAHPLNRKDTGRLS